MVTGGVGARASRLSRVLFLYALCLGCAFRAEAQEGMQVWYWVSSFDNASFGAEILLRNTSAEPVRDWSLRFRTSHAVSDLSHAAWTAEGETVTVSGRGWTRLIPAGGAVWFSYRASHGGTVDDPTECNLNGQPCVFQTDFNQFDPPGTDDPGGGGGAGVEVDLRFTSVWDGGFVAAAVIKNPGTTYVQGWQLRFGFDGVIDRAWNGVMTRSGRNYTFRNEEWNRWIAPGDSVYFGFEGSFSGELQMPDSCTFNGSVCTFAPAFDETLTQPPRIVFRYTAVWDGGYVANIAVINDTDRPIRGWRLSFALPLSIGALWNGRYQFRDGRHEIADVGWNHVIGRGDSAYVGFQGVFRQMLVTPTNCTFNGLPCSVAAPPAASVAASSEREGIPSDQNHRLSTPFPNPSRNTATLLLDAWRRDDVTVELLDLRGRRVAYLFSGAVNPGTQYPIGVEGHSLPGGLYFVRVSGREGNAVRAMHLLK